MAETRKLTCGHCGAVLFTVRPKVASCPRCGTAYGDDAEAATFAHALGEAIVPNLAANMAAARASDAPAVAPDAAPAAEKVAGKRAARPARSRKAKG